MLDRIFGGAERILEVGHIDTKGLMLFKVAEGVGFEGIVAKRADAPYPPRPARVARRLASATLRHRKLAAIPEIRGDKIYRTVSHPDGWSGLPDYEVKGDRIFRTVTHALGWSGLPDYDIRGGQVFRSVTHPGGWSGLADYDIV